MYRFIHLFDVLCFNLSTDHVLRESLVGLDPGLSDVIGKVVLQGRLQCVDQSVAHDGKHLRLDTIAHVLDSKFSHNLGQQLDIGAQHVQGRVDHLNKVGSVHNETLTRENLRCIGINIDREPKKYLGLRALLKKTGTVIDV
jgi:hypothetical protein